MRRGRRKACRGQYGRWKLREKSKCRRSRLREWPPHRHRLTSGNRWWLGKSDASRADAERSAWTETYTLLPMTLQVSLPRQLTMQGKKRFPSLELFFLAPIINLQQNAASNSDHPGQLNAR